MKTQAKKRLEFKKSEIVELTDNTLLSINGGTDNTGFEGEGIISLSRFTSDLCNYTNK